MSEFNQRLPEAYKNVFDRCTDGIVIIKNGEILYGNAPALNIFKNLKVGASAADVFPGIFQEMGERASSGTRCVSVSAGGQQVEMCVTYLGEYTALQLLPENSGVIQDGQFITSTMNAIRSTLSVFNMAFGLALPHLENAEDEQVSKYMAMMRHSYYAVLRMTNDIQEICKAPEGDEVRDPRDFAVFDLAEECRAMVETVSFFTAESGVSILFDSPLSVLDFYGDRRKIEQLLLKLLSNSLKHTSQGDCVRVSLYEQAGSVYLSVEDNGEGIPERVLSCVFSKYKAPEQIPGPKDGLGVGLALVQKIARQHGGSAFLESREGQGTKVTVALPNEIPEQDMNSPVRPYHVMDETEILTELSDVLDYTKYMKTSL